MSEKIKCIKKIANVTGVVMIMLGTIPAPVLAQTAPELAVGGAAAIDLTLVTSYKDLLGPVLACEGDDCTPEDPVEETQEVPVEVDLSPTPTLEPVPAEEQVPSEEEDLCPNDDNKLEPGICGCGKADVDTDLDGTMDCEDECPEDDTNTCHAEPVEAAANEEESVAEEVAAIADAGLVLTNEEQESVSLASNEAVEIIQSADPYFTSGGNKYCYIHGGGTCAGDCYECIETTTPIQDAIDRAATLLPDDDTIYIEAGAYSGFTIDNFGANLTISAAGQGSTFVLGQINLTNNTNNITLSNFTAFESGGSGGNTPTINALGNSGTITLQHLTVISNYDSGVWIDNHAGDVFIDDVDVDAGGNDEAVYIDNTLGSGNVQVDDSTFHSDENSGLVVASAGEVKLDHVTSNDNGDWNDSGHGAVIDNSFGEAEKNVTVLNSIFNHNQGDGLRVFSNGWILLDNVTANDNENKGAYLETTGPGVMVLNSEFKDHWCCGESQEIGLEIKHTGGDHETTICNTVATGNDDKQIKLTSPTGDEQSSFIYNFCDVDTGGQDIKIYGGAEWEVVANPPCPPGQESGHPDPFTCYEWDAAHWEQTGNPSYSCPPGQTLHNGGCYVWFIFWWWYQGPATQSCPPGQETGHPRSDKCYEYQDGEWDEKGDVITETHGNITAYEWETDGVWSQKFINLIHPCGEESGGCCGCCCGGSDYDEECLYCDEVCELPGACGDGVLDDGEECDDGNIINGDGCSSTCELEEYCGDGIVNGDEECDGQEHCLPDCTWEEWCGDGLLNGQEECDPAAQPGQPGYDPNCRQDCTIPFCGDGIIDTALGETCDGEGYCREDCTFCGDEVLQGDHGETCDGEEYCRQDCTFCGDAIVNGEEICDPAIPEHDYCNQECGYKEFADLDLDPHCSGVGMVAWSVINPNPYSVPNVQVIVDGELRFDGTLPAATEVGMGTTPDGPLMHYMTVTWPDGAGTVRTDRICEPTFVPGPLPIPVTGETFIIPVTGADILDALARQQQLLVTGGAALVGISILIGSRRKKK